MNDLKDLAVLVGRILLASLFVVSGVGKITGFAATAGYMASKGLPATDVLLVLTILVEVGGGLAIIVGWQTRWAALAALLFTALATVLFHNFWALPADQAVMQKFQFLKNLAIMGGLFVLMASGPGRFAFDRGRS
jgi:putative oxidoreductase